MKFAALSITVIITILLLNWSVCEELFYDVYDIEEGKIYCFTKSYYANSLNSFLEESSVYIPNPKNYDWKIPCTREKETYKCVKTLSDKLIVDVRWEDLPVLQNSTHSLKIVSSDNFDIFVSLYIDPNDDEGILSFLDENNNHLVQIVPSFFDNTLVFKNIIDKSESSVYFKFVLTNKWNHFQISKQKDELYIKQLNPEVMDVALFKTTVLNKIQHIRFDEGRWKLHEIEYFNITEVANEITIEPSILFENGSVCISMFVKTCGFCSFTSVLRADDDVLWQSKEYSYLVDWTRIEAIVENTGYENAKLQFSTTISANASVDSQFWYISSIRRCTSSGVRMMSRQGNDRCEPVIPRPSLSNSDLSKGLNPCPENSIGSNCMPCKWFMKENNCSRLVIWENQQDNFICSAGYKHSSGCYDECDDNFYGHNCQNICGKCQNSTCNKINGSCSSLYCNDDFTGAECNIPPEALFFKEPPLIENVSYVSAKIRVENFELIEGIRSPKPTFFSVQYKIERTGTQWISMDDTYEFGKPISIIPLNNLKKGTTYLVRLIFETFPASEHESLIPFGKFRTLCDPITRGNFDLRKLHEHFEIIFSLNETNCEYELGTIGITSSDSSKVSKKVTKSKIIFSKLNTNTTFYISMGDSVLYVIKTLENIDDDSSGKSIQKTEGVNLNYILITILVIIVVVIIMMVIKKCRSSTYSAGGEDHEDELNSLNAS